ncbi:MAG: hypothetical protein K1X57_22775 [Gemmataceae bacterium]|nr:hypothetical protein [Gemmataceae bacterium]
MLPNPRVVSPRPGPRGGRGGPPAGRSLRGRNGPPGPVTPPKRRVCPWRELRDDTCRESIRIRDDGLGLTLAGPAAVAAIWPKELLGAFAVKPGRYALARIGRILEFDGLSGATRVPALVGGRARLVGAEVLRVELLQPGTRCPFRVLIGTRAAVEAAEQHRLPQESYAEAAGRGIAVVDDRCGFRPATIGSLAIVAATGAPWIGFDADGAIVELGAVEPHHDDVAERSSTLLPT